MNDSNSLSKSQNIDILSLARGIYELLNINKEIESEDELFSDEVYIEIITKIIPDIQDEISPGSTPEEKVETIKMLLSLLGNLVEANLSTINAKKIVLEHDKESAKNFLELLLELINVIINSGGEELEDEDENDIETRENISEENINNNRTEQNSFDAIKKHNFDKEEEVNIDDLESLKLSRDKKNEKNKKNENEESEEMKIDGNFILDKEKSQSEKNLIFDMNNNEENNEVNKSNSKVMNVSHITDDIKDEKKEELENNNISSSNKKNKNKNKDINTDNNDIDNDIDNDEKLNSNKKYDIPALLEGEANDHGDKEKNKKSTEEFNYIENDDDDLSKKEIKFEENKYNFQGSDDDISSNNVKESAYSVPRPFNKFVLTNNSSEEYGDSILKKEKEKEKNKKKKEEEEDDFDLNYNDELEEKDSNLNLNLDNKSKSSLLNSNISLHSRKSKKSNRINDSKFQDSSNKKGSSKKKESVLGGGKISNNPSSKKGSHANTKNLKNELENENDLSESQSNDISKSSVYTIPQGQKSNASSKKNSKILKNENNLNKSKQSNISKKSKAKSTYSTIINSEIPLDDRELKYELLKELKKIYGNKLNKALLENNNILDIIIQDLKLTKKQENLQKKDLQQSTDSKDKDKEKDKEKSIDKNIDIYNTDDVFLSKEFLKKNQKQIQQKLQMYTQKVKQKQIEQEKYIRDIGQNVQFMKKIRELEQKRVENDIQRKKEMLKNNNDAEEIYFCQKVFENYYQLEMDKCAKEIESIKMINDMKFKEKLKSIKDIDRYYKDKIAILNEIGRRERIEKKRSKMEDELIYLQLNSMPKRELKNKMKQILNSLDDEYYNNVEVDNNNQEEIEKILDNYYKK